MTVLESVDAFLEANPDPVPNPAPTDPYDLTVPFVSAYHARIVKESQATVNRSNPDPQNVTITPPPSPPTTVPVVQAPSK